MTAVTEARPVAAPPARPQHLRADDDAEPRPSRVLPAAAALAGVGVLWAVVRDGEPGWQAVRGAAAAVVTVVVVLGLRRAGRRGGALLATAGGLPALATGVGLAVPHLAKAGVTATAVAGLMALAGGLVLLVGGATSFVRSARWWGRLLSIPLVLVLLYVSLWSLGQAVAATNVPHTTVGVATPADAGFAYEDVELTTADGVTLSGWYVRSRNGAAVVLAHGAGSTRSGVLDQAVVLAQHGYGVLLVDARGHGRSEGRAMDFGWYGDEDLTAAVSFLAGRSDVDGGRIGVVGLSMGGEEAIGAAAGDERIQAVVAEGAGHRQAADKAWLSDELGARGWFQEQVERLTYALTDLLTDADPPIALRDAVAATAPRPVLLIAGGAAHDERTESRYIAEGSPDTVEVWVVPGAGHTAGLDTDPAEWEQQVIDFLDDAL
jgi:pimeloyl-ACP methyl ester carboxylesterase